MKDVSGRVNKSFDGLERFNRWGKHFVRALIRAHIVQQCTNPLDPGVQFYGGALFRSLRDQGKVLFTALPPPIAPLPECPMCGGNFSADQIQTHFEHCMGGGYTPEIAPQSAALNVAANNWTPEKQPAEEVNMNIYTTDFGGCFDGRCTIVVRMPCGQLETRAVSDLQAGDDVMAQSGQFSRIVCVVESHYPASLPPLLALPEDGPILTRNHPVQMPNGHWVRPCQVSGHRAVRSTADRSVYNMVVAGEPVLMVDGYPCVTLGHGLSGEVVGHPFYGTQRVVEMLQESTGWQKGYIHIHKAIKNNNHQIIGFLE